LFELAPCHSAVGNGFVATMSTIQHQEARKLLEVIHSAETGQGGPLDYKKAAKALGRDPEKNAKMVAQVCDLLDAAAALAGVPLLALVKVRELSGEINRKAFADVENRQAIIDRSLNHNFSDADFAEISKALGKLDGKGNRAAWQFVHEAGWYLRLTEPAFEQRLDAINDIGTETPSRMTTTGVMYARDSKIREAVKRRAAGKCEFCGELGFFCADGYTLFGVSSCNRTGQPRGGPNEERHSSLSERSSGGSFW
jgi:hypothetical protein